VLEQAQNVCRTTIVQDAWARGQNVAVHGMIYAVADGLLRDLEYCATSETDNGALFERAVAGLTAPR
jgi:carbonic anhydrase